MSIPRHSDDIPCHWQFPEQCNSRIIGDQAKRQPVQEQRRTTSRTIPTKAQQRRLTNMHPARRALEISFIGSANHPPVGSSKVKVCSTTNAKVAKCKKKTSNKKPATPARPVKAAKSAPVALGAGKSERMMIYCVGCKQKTMSENVKVCLTKNRRKVVKAICCKCNRRKAQFIQG